MNSLMEMHPRLQWLLTWCDVFRDWWWMQKFGAPTRKPTWGYSNKKGPLAKLKSHYVTEHKQVATQSLVKYWHNEAGEKRFSGRATLKATQTYTAGFAAAYEAVYTAERENFEASARALHEQAKLLPCPVLWPPVRVGPSFKDAELCGVFELLL